MSSRSSRARVTPVPESGPRPRAPSPLSPIRIKRTEEKQELGVLNSRLAGYIDKVRSLELEKCSLSKQISTIEETNSKEVTRVQNLYNKELQQVGQAGFINVNTFLIIDFIFRREKLWILLLRRRPS